MLCCVWPFSSKGDHGSSTATNDSSPNRSKMKKIYYQLRVNRRRADRLILKEFHVEVPIYARARDIVREIVANQPFRLRNFPPTYGLLYVNGVIYDHWTMTSLQLSDESFVVFLFDPALICETCITVRNLMGGKDTIEYNPWLLESLTQLYSFHRVDRLGKPVSRNLMHLIARVNGDDVMIETLSHFDRVLHVIASNEGRFDCFREQAPMKLAGIM